MADPALVFLHGWTMDGAIFADQCARLGERYACHAPTLPGHGPGALVGEGALSIAAMADAVAHYIAVQRLHCPVLVGWSLGAMVAWAVTQRHPRLALSGLVAVDMSPKILNAPGWRHGIRGFSLADNDRAIAAMHAQWPDYAARIHAGMYARGPAQAPPETLQMIRARAPGEMIAVWQSLCAADARAAVADLRCPMLIVKGTRSRIYALETAHWLLSAAPVAQLALFEASGHSPHLEQPALFADTLAAWLARLGTHPQRPRATLGLTP
jgi:pimeloyl-[acyl-carrier protein] methyl ester esterase